MQNKAKGLILFLLFAVKVYCAGSQIKIILNNVPYNSNNSITMEQSIELAKSNSYLYDEGYSYIIKKLFGEHKINNGINADTAILYLMYSQLPLGDAWLHEEFHKSILAKNGINSYNEVYDLKLFSKYISVKNIKDDDLSVLKKEKPVDFIRLMSAGYEAQNELANTIEEDIVLKDSYKTGMGKTIVLFNILNNILYLRLCSSSKADDETNEVLNREDNNIKNRDFAGLDYTAWVYDLFRQEEAYEKRGAHPSGTGIKRYIRYSDLNENEKRYLEEQSNLSIISLIDSTLFGIDNFLNGETKLNINMRHYLAPFGNRIDTRFIYKNSKTKLSAIISLNRNYLKYFPGIEIKFVDYPMIIENKKINVTTRLCLWNQPENLRFQTEKDKIGGLFEIGSDFSINDRLSLFSSVMLKTDGWVPGIEELGFSSNIKTGIKVNLD